MSERETPWAREVGAEELRELFRHERPDASAFAAALEKRLRELELELGGEQRARDATSPARLRSSLARRVAALLPAELGAALSASSGAKGLGLAVVLPALVVSATFGAFAAALSSLRSTARASRALSAPGAEPREPAPGSVKQVLAGTTPARALLGLVEFGTLAALWAASVLGSSIALDVLCAALLLAMGALALGARSLGRAGLLGRTQVAEFTTLVLLSVTTGVYLWRGPLGFPDPSALGTGLGAGVVLAGLVASALALWPGSWPHRIGAGFVLAWSCAFALLNPFGFTRSDPDSLRADFARLALDASELSGWREAAAIHEALRAAGLEPPDARETRAELARAVAVQANTHPVVWTAASRMDLLDERDWRALGERPLESRALDSLLHPTAPFNATDYYEYRVPMLLALRRPSAAELEPLVAKLEALLVDPSGPSPLDDAALALRLLGVLGRSEIVQRERESVRALLERHWIPSGTGRFFARAGGFSSYPDTIRASHAGSTWKALELSSAVGPPPGIDLFALRSYLRAESRASSLFGPELLPHLRVLSRASLLRLEREIDLPRRSLLQRISDERLSLAAILLVALCLAAIALAPASTSASVPLKSSGR